MAKRCKKGLEAALAALDARVQAVRDQAPLVAREDPEGIHDLRVASRRLRAALAEFAPMSPKKPNRAFREEVRQITRLLGRPRELDVMLAQLADHDTGADAQAQAALSHVVDLLRERRNGVAARCRDAAAIPSRRSFASRYKALRKAMAAVSTCQFTRARERQERLYGKLHEAYRHWHDGAGPEALHQVRIFAKKLRYTCEIYAPLYGEELAAFILRLKETQSLLGDWNDCRVLHDEIADIAAIAPSSAAAAVQELARAFDAQRASFQAAFVASADVLFSEAERQAAQELFRKSRLRCCV